MTGETRAWNLDDVGMALSSGSRTASATHAATSGRRAPAAGRRPNRATVSARVVHTLIVLTLVLALLDAYFLATALPHG